MNNESINKLHVGQSRTFRKQTDQKQSDTILGLREEGPSQKTFQRWREPIAANVTNKYLS